MYVCMCRVRTVKMGNHIEHLVDRTNINIIGLQVLGLNIFHGKCQPLGSDICFEGLKNGPIFVPCQPILKNLHHPWNGRVIVHGRYPLASFHPWNAIVVGFTIQFLSQRLNGWIRFCLVVYKTMSIQVPHGKIDHTSMTPHATRMQGEPVG